jgi:signal transduction histidine kinase
LSIRTKLTAMILVSTTLALALAGTAFIWYQRHTLEQSMLDATASLTRILSVSNTAAMMFDAREDATESLAALAAKPSIILAALYRSDGSLFAEYVRAGAPHPHEEVSLDALGPRFGYGYLAYTHPVTVEGEKLGVVYLVASLEEVRQAEQASIAVVTILSLLSLLLAMLLSRRLTRVISDPISELSGVAAQVSLHDDYTIRARHNSDDEIGALVDTFNDMLDQIALHDEELRRHGDNLEEQVLERTGQLQGAKERAENANELKDKFVSLVSHDLRSPIASSIVLLQQLRVQVDAPDGKTQTLIHKRLTATLDHMLELIDSLLNLNRLQGGAIRLQRRTERLRELCDKVIGPMMPLAHEKKVAIINDIDPDATLFIDHTLTEELIRNLVSNAVKFSRADDRVTLTTSVDEEGAMTLAVADTGTGIRPDFIENLFKKEFKTTSPGTAGERGTGLGLLLSHDIMIAHGGDIVVESTPGHGATFKATFPKVRPAVLLVDDQDVVRKTFRDALAPLDLAIMEAENGAEALKHIELTPPHLIITDIHMPVMDGFAFLEQLKANPLTSDIPTIVATSLAGVEVRGKVFRLGADDYISKPVMEEDLIPRVHRFIG